MIHKNNNKVEFSYFQLNLLSFLKNAHPDKIDDVEFIKQRGDSAAESYSTAIKDGLDHIQAAEIANNVLFKGLHFSPINTITEILYKQFPNEAPSNILKKKEINIIAVCAPIFQKYELTDDFIATPEYELLYTELVGTISFALNGVQ